MECMQKVLLRFKNFILLSTMFPLNEPDISSTLNLFIVQMSVMRVLFIILSASYYHFYNAAIIWYTLPNAAMLVFTVLLMLIARFSVRNKRIICFFTFIFQYFADFETTVYFSVDSQLYMIVIGYSALYCLFNAYIIGKIYLCVSMQVLVIVYFITRLCARKLFTSMEVEWIITIFAVHITILITTYVIIKEHNGKCAYKENYEEAYYNWKQTMGSSPIGYLLMQGNAVLYSNEYLDTLFKKLRTNETQTFCEIFDSILYTAKPMEVIPTTQSEIEFKLINVENQIIEWRKQKIENQSNSATLNIFIDVTEKANTKTDVIQKKYIDMLVASSTHELRTPLNGIKSFILFALPKCLEESKELLCRALSACELQESLINDIMDFAKIQGSNMVINDEEISIVKLLHDCYGIFEFQAKEKSLTLEIKIHENTPETIRSDLRRIKQILLNLLSNSLKFTTKGGIILGAKKKSNNLEFYVADSGVGIKEEDIQRLFKPYVMIESSSKMNKNGTGLGLNLCKNLSQRLGGDIRVKSNVNMGTKFTFHLPLHISSSIADSTKGLKSERSFMDDNRNIKDLLEPTQLGFASVCKFHTKTCLKSNSKVSRRNKIFLVDDTPFNVTIAAKLFKALKYDVIKAYGGQEAVEIIKKHNFEIEIAFIDLNMPIMDGYELCSTLKKMMKDKIINKFVIIALTAEDKNEVEALCLAKGFSDVVCKPLSKEAVQLILKKHLTEDNGRN